MRRTSWALLSLLGLAASLVTVLMPGTAAAVGSVWGPDVADYQHPNGAAINWSEVHNDGAKFAIVKATQGTFYTNSYWKSDVTNARKAGLVVGSYDFADPQYPISSAVGEAKFFWNFVKGVFWDSATNSPTSNTLPPILDIEQANGLSPAQTVAWAQTWVDTMYTLSKRSPLIYSYGGFVSTSMANTTAFPNDPLWIAAYQTSPPPAPTGWPFWTLWQYTDAGTVKGIVGQVDQSTFNGDATRFAAFAKGTPDVWKTTTATAPLDLSARWTGRPGAVRLSWLPTYDGGAQITGYRITAAPPGSSLSSPSNATFYITSGPNPQATMAGLSPSRIYVFTVQALTAAGRGAAPNWSTKVQPYIPTGFTSSLSPTRVSYGSGKTVTMSALLTRTDTGAALPGLPVNVWVREHGTSTWQAAGVVHTNSQGYATYNFTPTTSTDVRFTLTQSNLGYQPMASPARTVTVVPRLYAAISPGNAARCSAVTMSGRIAPVLGGTLVYRQQRVSGTWRDVGSSTISSTGHIAMTWKACTAGVYTYRLATPPVPGYGGGASNNVRLVVDPTMAAAFGASSYLVCQTVTLLGQTSPVLAGATAYVQEDRGGVWTTVGKATVGTTGHTAASWKDCSLGTFSYRWRVPATGPYPATVSDTTKLTTVKAITITVSIAPNPVAVCKSFTLTASVAPASMHGKSVDVQQVVSGKWATKAIVRISSSGRIGYSSHSCTVGKEQWRVHLPAGTDYPAATSAVAVETVEK
jgi:GH25 family lysozyme M1 (1,4-beta-N-acetylmuramidase)